MRNFMFYNSVNSWGWLDYLLNDIKNNIDIFAENICDVHSVKNTMQGCDVVFHLAELIGIPYSYHSPDTYVDTNIKGTWKPNVSLEDGLKYTIKWISANLDRYENRRLYNIK